MRFAALLFILFSLLNGRLQAQILTGTAVLDPNCIPLKSCNKFAGSAGICVQLRDSRQCWDACDFNKTLDEYAGTAQDMNTRKAIAMMVQQARTVQNMCPGAQWSKRVQCDLGYRCTAVTLYRGMCSSSPPNAGPPTCLDMCDLSIPLKNYASGAGEAVISKVQLVRGGKDPDGYTTCPSTSVWLWLWFPILLICIIGGCAGSYVAFKHWKKVNKNSGRTRQLSRDDFPSEYVQGLPPVHDMAQANYMEVPGPFPMEATDRDLPMAPPQTNLAPVDHDRMPVMANPAQQAPEVAPVTDMFKPGFPPEAAPLRNPFTGQGMNIAAPSTFYNSQHLSVGNPVGSMYSAPLTRHMPDGSYRLG